MNRITNIVFGIALLASLGAAAATGCSGGDGSEPGVLSSGSGGGSESSSGGGGSGSGAVPPPAGNACAVPSPGCPCRADGQHVKCGLVSNSGGQASCGQGVSTCVNGVWSSCVVDNAPTGAGSELHLQHVTLKQAPGFHPITYDLANDASSCNEPCDPFCQTFIDTPDPSLSTDGGIVATEAGLTMSGIEGGIITWDAAPDGPPNPGVAALLADAGEPLEGGFFYHELLPGQSSSADPLVLNAAVSHIDIYFLLDTSATMGPSLVALGNAVGGPTGIIQAVQTSFPAARFGVGHFHGYQVQPQGSAYSSYSSGRAVSSLWHTLDLQSASTPAEDVMLWLGNGGTTANANATEGSDVALYASATTTGLWGNSYEECGGSCTTLTQSTTPSGYWVNPRNNPTGSPAGSTGWASDYGIYNTANAIAPPSLVPNEATGPCPSGTSGYPCFGAGNTPITIVMTDNPGEEGPNGMFAETHGLASGDSALGLVDPGAIPGSQPWPAPTALTSNGTEATAYPIDPTKFARFTGNFSTNGAPAGGTMELLQDTYYAYGGSYTSMTAANGGVNTSNFPYFVPAASGSTGYPAETDWNSSLCNTTKNLGRAQREAFFSFTLANAGFVHFDTWGSPNDNMMYIYNSTTRKRVGCDDDQIWSGSDPSNARWGWEPSLDEYLNAGSYTLVLEEGGDHAMVSACPAGYTWDAADGTARCYKQYNATLPSAANSTCGATAGAFPASVRGTYGAEATTDALRAATDLGTAGTSIVAINVTSGGLYTVAPVVTLAPVLHGAAATAVLGSTGSLETGTFALATKGSLYTTAPAVSFTGAGGTGSGATGTATLATTGSLLVGNGQAVAASGSGYSCASPFAVTFAGGAGSGATGTATLATSGALTTGTFALTTQGSGYTSAPTPVFGGGGSGAAGTTTLGTAGSLALGTYPPNTAGSGYTSAPTVTFTNGGGTTQATGSTTIAGPVSTTPLTLTGGAGYTSVPTATVSGGSGGSGFAVTPTFSVTGTTAVTQGSGYTTAPTITFPAPPVGGTQATATTALSGYVNTVTFNAPVVSGISGVAWNTTAPTASLSGGGFTTAATLTPTTTAVATKGVTTAAVASAAGTTTPYTPSCPLIVNLTRAGAVSATVTLMTTPTGTIPVGTPVTILNPGSAYSGAPTGYTYFGCGAGTPALAFNGFTIGTYVELTGLSVATGGAGYTSAPTVAFANLAAQSGTPTASTTITDGVTVTITNGGSGYTTIPLPAIAGGGGAGFGVTFTDSVSGLTITGGSGYTAVPTLGFSGGGGTTQATATLKLNGSVTGVIIATGGAGYTSAPTVTFGGGGGGSGASFTPTAFAYGVASITITAGGTGYAAPATITFSGGGGSGASYTPALNYGIASVNVTAAGTNYTAPVTTTFTCGSGTGASFTPTVTYGVASVTVLTGGSGYVAPVTTTFTPSGAGSGAAFTPTLGYGVASVTVTNGGWAYTTPPTVSFATTHGSGGVATAALGGITVGLTYNGSTWVWADGSTYVPALVPWTGGAPPATPGANTCAQINLSDTVDAIPCTIAQTLECAAPPTSPSNQYVLQVNAASDSGLAQSTPNPNQVVVGTPIGLPNFDEMVAAENAIGGKIIGIDASGEGTITTDINNNPLFSPCNNSNDRNPTGGLDNNGLAGAAGGSFVQSWVNRWTYFDLQEAARRTGSIDGTNSNSWTNPFVFALGYNGTPCHTTDLPLNTQVINAIEKLTATIKQDVTVQAFDTDDLVDFDGTTGVNAGNVVLTPGNLDEGPHTGATTTWDTNIGTSYGFFVNTVQTVAVTNGATGTNDPAPGFGGCGVCSYGSATCPCRCGGMTADTFQQCLPDTVVQFNVTFAVPTSIPQLVNEQIFRFDLQVRGSGSGNLGSVPVVIVVPPANQTLYPPTDFIRDFDVSSICGPPNVQNEAPHWGLWSWTAQTPSNSRIDFFARSATSEAGLATASEVQLEFTAPPEDAGLAGVPIGVVNGTAQAGATNVGTNFQLTGLPQYDSFVRIRAHFTASTDVPEQIPVLQGWNLEFDCLPSQ